MSSLKIFQWVVSDLWARRSRNVFSGTPDTAKFESARSLPVMSTSYLAMTKIVELINSFISILICFSYIFVFKGVCLLLCYLNIYPLLKTKIRQFCFSIYQVFRKKRSEIYELINLKLLIGISSKLAHLILIMLWASM